MAVYVIFDSWRAHNFSFRSRAARVNFLCIGRTCVFLSNFSIARRGSGKSISAAIIALSVVFGPARFFALLLLFFASLRSHQFVDGRAAHISAQLFGSSPLSLRTDGGRPASAISSSAMACEAIINFAVRSAGASTKHSKFEAFG